MLTTKEAIKKRRSIRNFKPDRVSEECLNELVEAARLAPSGCNSQPWRFRIVKDRATKLKLARAAFDQPFVAKAPAVFVCCVDMNGYLDGSESGVRDLCSVGAVDPAIADALGKRINNYRKMKVEELLPQVMFNAAVAIEHIVLRALDFGLGS